MISSPVGTRLGTQRLPGSGEGGCDIRCRLIAIKEAKREKRISKEVTILSNIHSPSIHALPYSSIPTSLSYLHPFFSTTLFSSLSFFLSPSLLPTSPPPTLPTYLPTFYPSYLPPHLLPFRPRWCHSFTTHTY
jgi:hypothetical protein